MTGGKPNHRSVMAATLVASILMLLFGLTYRVLAVRLAIPVAAALIPRETLQRLPLQIAEWTGQDVPVEEAIVRATGTDAHVNRRYARHEGRESVSLFVGCGVNAYERTIHRPEICYVRAGWRLMGRRPIELPLADGTRLPCSLFQFSRGGLAPEKATVLHYFLVDGQYYDNVTVLRSRLWRLGTRTDYLARVMIVAPHATTTVDAATKVVSAFAVDSAFSIARVFEDLAQGRNAGEAPRPVTRE